jgi:hypothetical protein
MKTSTNDVKKIDCITDISSATIFELENAIKEIEKSLKISRDDFKKMNDCEKAYFINEVFFEYTGEKCIYERDGWFFDIDSDTVIDDLYDYGLSLNDEATDVQNKLFK